MTPGGYEELPCKKWNSVAGVTVWSVVKHLDRDSATIDILRQMVLPKMPLETESMSWSPNSTLLAIGKGTPERAPTEGENCPHQPGVILVQTNRQGTLTITHNLTGPSRPTSSVDFSPGNRVIARSNDGTIMAWTAIIPQTTLPPLLTALITLLTLIPQKKARKR